MTPRLCGLCHERLGGVRCPCGLGPECPVEAGVCWPCHDRVAATARARAAEHGEVTRERCPTCGSITCGRPLAAAT